MTPNYQPVDFHARTPDELAAATSHLWPISEEFRTVSAVPAIVHEDQSYRLTLRLDLQEMADASRPRWLRRRVLEAYRANDQETADYLEGLLEMAESLQ